LGSKPNGYSPGYINNYPAKNQILTLQRDLQLAHAQANMSKRQAPTPQTIIYFYFLVLPSPKIEGVGRGGGAQQQQQQKSAAAAAAARQGKRDKYT
jgi:hypothetical protein